MAAPLLALESIVLTQGQGRLFDGLDLFVGERDRLALVGRNGAGKTTLLRLLAGRIEADSGRRTLRPGTRVVLLEQDPDVAGFARLADFAAAGADAPPAHALAAIADQLGVDLDREAATASGGERRRAAIVRALAAEPDLLLLDEPTNHLDIAAIEWLEARLQRFAGAFVAISHDRMFLSRLTRNTLWLDRGRLRRAEIGFGGFEAWAETVAEEDAKAADRLDTKLKQELHWLARGVTARRKRNQGRLARLGELRAERRALTGPQGVAKLGLASDDARTRVVIDAEKVGKAFGGRPILSDFSLRVMRGDRIGIIGPNGAGKSTLLKLLTGELAPDSGRIRRSATQQLIVIDQQRSRLTPGKTVRDVLADGGEWLDVRGTRKHLAGYLKDFLFTGDVMDAPVESFSGGERSRLLLAREFARPSNLLVLDEPTNDLDLETLDLLEEVIADYTGTVLLVSHDRDFLDRTVTAVVALDGSGRAEVEVGGWSDWAARRAAPAEARRAAAAASPAPAAAPRTPAKLSYKEQRELDLLPGEIDTVSRAIAAAEAAMADPELYARDRARFDALVREAETARARLAQAEERWLELAARAEALAAS